MKKKSKKMKLSRALFLVVLCVSGHVLSAVSDSVLFQNETLYSDEAIESSNGVYTLVMKGNGNVELLENGSSIIFQSATQGNYGASLIMQSDGNLVAYDVHGNAIFNTGTAGNSGAFARLDDDGRLVIIDSSGQNELWASAVQGCDTDQGHRVGQSITPHFQQWLEENGYGEYNLARSDLLGDSFGGKMSDSDCTIEQPVIFVHGNGDKCNSGLIGGWGDSVEYFLSRGYRSSELFCTTYGDGALSVATNYHSKEYVMRIRKMIEAVKAYTGAEKVDVIGHSMGVTMARKAIKGGWANDMLAGGEYYVGDPIGSVVDTFIGIAGGNKGLASCYLTGPITPGCGSTNGFYPGYYFWWRLRGVSDFLVDLNSSSRYEGDYRYSMWSVVDEVVGGACLVWGKNTCRVPGQTGEKVFSTYPYGHLGLKSETGYYQYRMVHDHATN